MDIYYNLRKPEKFPPILFIVLLELAINFLSIGKFELVENSERLDS